VNKHQIPSTCLRRSGYAQAGQIPNKLQSSISKSFGDWGLVIETLFGIWDLRFGIYRSIIILIEYLDLN
jgi:hypothetical protein